MTNLTRRQAMYVWLQRPYPQIFAQGQEFDLVDSGDKNISSGVLIKRIASRALERGGQELIDMLIGFEPPPAAAPSEHECYQGFVCALHPGRMWNHMLDDIDTCDGPGEPCRAEGCDVVPVTPSEGVEAARALDPTLDAALRRVMVARLNDADLDGETMVSHHEAFTRATATAREATLVEANNRLRFVVWGEAAVVHRINLHQSRYVQDCDYSQCMGAMAALSGDTEGGEA